MSLLRILIVDDEALARDRLRGLLKQEPDTEIIGECANGAEALAAIRAGTPDLVFLDMQMPGGDGLQVIARLPEDRRPAIVFATAHDQYAVEAFDVAAVDYLLKPFDLDRLRLALQRARDYLLARAAPGNVTPGEPVATRKTERLAVRTDGRIVFLRLNEIIRVEADDNHVVLHLANGRLMLRDTLTALESRLDPAVFLRVNRSTVVHVDQIRELQPALHGDYTILLRDGTRLPLGRNMGARLRSLFSLDA
jgi:two-component system LytT family response regulator